MLIVRHKCSSERAHDAVLELPFERRQQSRLRTRATDGEEIGLMLERGATLRDGDVLEADDGRVVRVVAAAESLLEIRSDDPRALARAAYHLGNRHASVEIGAGWLRCAADPVLAGLLRGLGLDVRETSAPFQPEPGAYAAGQHAHASNARHAGVIHDFVARGSPRER